MATGTIADNPEIFRLFDAASMIFRERYQKPSKGKHDVNDPMEAAIMFLGFGFQHAGTNPSYVHAAVDAIKMSKGSEDFPLAVLVNFHDLLYPGGLNLKVNPLYHRCWRCYQHLAQTNPCNCIWCVLKRENIDNIVLRSKNDLEAGQTRVAWERLRKIRGVKNKIASFFLRDVAIEYNLTPTEDRWLLQPIDVWVRRIVHSLNNNPQMSDEDIAKWIVETSLKNGINPEHCNQGIWYFGAKIAESSFILEKSLNDINYAREVFTEHITVLKAVGAPEFMDEVEALCVGR